MLSPVSNIIDACAAGFDSFAEEFSQACIAFHASDSPVHLEYVHPERTFVSFTGAVISRWKHCVVFGSV